MTDLLCLDMTELYADLLFSCDHVTDWDAHSLMVKPEDREAFLDSFAAAWRKRAEELLKERGEQCQ